MATQQQRDELMDALTDAQLASGATAAEFAAYLGALVAAAVEAGLTPQDVAAIVKIGGLTTKMSALDAQIAKRRDEMDEVVAAKQAAITVLNEERMALQALLKNSVGG